MTLRIPRAPGTLSLAVDRELDGSPCPDVRLHAHVGLQAGDDGLRFEARVPDPEPARVPSAPPGRRVADLWHYDVVECFLVGEGGRYLEVELSAGGHFLLLSFDAPRRRVDAHEDARPPLDFQRGAAGWAAAIRLPWEIVPAGLCALNAFVCARDRFLAYRPLPGGTPDFHQPAHFPPVSLDLG